MQIHELNSPRRTDEGLGSWAKAVGKAAATGLGHSISKGAGYDLSKDDPTASAGILDPKQKLAAVMREPAMVKLATQYADEWLKDPRSKVQAPAQAVPEAVTERRSAPRTIATKPATVPAPGFNANNLMNLPGMQKYAAPAAGTQPQPSTSSSRINKADPNNPNIKDQNRYVQGRAGSGAGGDATKFAKYDPATSAVANAGQGINNMVRGGVAAQQPAAPAKTTGTAMPLKPFQVPGAGTNPNPTKPAGYKAATAPPSAYVTDFLKWANEKVAMRDSATYKMLGLTAAENSDLKAELDAAKQEVISAQGNPTATKTAVKNYILTALAALQLVSSQNTVKAASPEAPAYGQQPTPAGQSGKTGAPASNSTAPTPATGQLTGSNAVALLNKAGLTAQALGKAGQTIQTATGNKQLSTSGDSVIDTMLEGMGYTVS